MNTYEEVPHRAAYERGATAKERGRCIEECPYGANEAVLRKAWLKGFDEATKRGSSRSNS